MKYLSLFLLATVISVSTQAKSHRVNNTPGVAANFNDLAAALASPAVGTGDTVYLEGTAFQYNNAARITKQLVIIGPGYYLDPSNGGNAGLQANTQDAYMSSTLHVDAGGAGSKIMGFVCQQVYLNGTNNILIERMRIAGYIYANAQESTNITVRKCYFNSNNFISEYSGGYINGLTFENNICAAGFDLRALAGTNNIIRNNNFVGNYSLYLVNAYFVNNISSYGNSHTFTNCTIKNNIFAYAQQTLPGTATGNITGQSMADVYENTGSNDGKYKLKAGSAATGKGLSVGTVTNPDCGAFGATDPYVLSGIPNVPAIYSITAPTSIPSGSPTMNITFSTRNNN